MIKGGENGSRQVYPPLFVAPAQKRFKTVNIASNQVYHGLIEGHDLIALDRDAREAPI